MKKLSLLCILACIVLVFVSCANNNNVDGSDDGIIDGKDTTAKLPDKLENDTTDDEKDTTDNQDGQQTTDDKKNDETEAPGDDGNIEEVKTKTIASDTGTGLNLVVEYTVGAKQNGSRSIDVAVYLESYSLNVTARGIKAMEK